MNSVFTAVARIRAPYKLVPENSPKGDSQANGSVERANRSVKGQLRVMLIALEARLKKKIDLRHPIVAWMTTHVGYILTHYEVGKDGRTPYERLKGKHTGIELCEFGETVHYMPLKERHNAVASAEARYKKGIWLGVDERTSERMIATTEGNIVGSRSVKRLPDEEKWDAEAVERITGVPWNHEGVDGAPAVVVFPERTDVVEPLPAPRSEGPIPRRLKLRRTDLEAHGFTEGCAGCDTQIANKRSADGRLITRTHSDECRQQLLEAIRQTP